MLDIALPGSASQMPPLTNVDTSSGRSVLNMNVLRTAGMVIIGRKRNRQAEEVHIAIIQLLRILREMPADAPRILMVTSARPGEGKTYCALNIAAGLARYGELNTLLVDTDAKPGSITGLLGMEDAPGLFNLSTAHGLSSTEVTVATDVENFSVIPVGAHARQCSEIPMQRSTAAAVQRIAAENPDHILVLDTAPCLSTSDPISLSSRVGIVVMVIEAESTQRPEVIKALDLVSHCERIAPLLNRAKLTNKSTFGYYEYY